EFCAPNIDGNTHPPFISVKSTQNIVIESFWRWLHEKLGMNLKEEILRGKREHIFQEHNEQHHLIFYWLFIPLVQGALDDFRTWWNQHKVRKQKEKKMPSGHIPVDAVKHCSRFGGHNCLIKVSEDAILDMRIVLEDEVGSRKANMEWYNEAFGEAAAEAYNAIGRPQVSLQNAWEIFLQLTVALDVV
ncbi:hypothetical protein P691DRAFT_678367, partial [Macrolepiota fuliginosa MF-IS2]